jgi:tripartite-type tricarboxylate transporter receptor subunit TctC
MLYGARNASDRREECMRVMARAAVLAAGLALLATPPALAQQGAAPNWPDKSVRMVVAFGAGGTLDTLARIVSSKLSEMWGQQVVVENRAGAGGNIGAAQVAQATPDGYTLHFGAQTLAVNVTIAPYKNFDPVRDFQPVVFVGTAQDVLMVPPPFPAKTVQELIDIAKKKPGELNYASAGPGSSGHLATVLFSELTGVKLQHVPYNSLSQGVMDIMSGRISVWIVTLGGHLGNIKSGKVRALAVSGESRAAQLPDVPTFKEIGIPFVAETSWYGIFAPKGTPRAIVDKINRDVNAVLALPEVKARGATLGYRFAGGPPERLGALLKSEIVKWAEIADRANLAKR